MSQVQCSCDLSALIIRYPDEVGFLLFSFFNIQRTSSSFATAFDWSARFPSPVPAISMLHSHAKALESFKGRPLWTRQTWSLNLWCFKYSAPACCEYAFPTKMLNRDRFILSNFRISTIFCFSALAYSTKWWSLWWRTDSLFWVPSQWRRSQVRKLYSDTCSWVPLVACIQQCFKDTSHQLQK